MGSMPCRLSAAPDLPTKIFGVLGFFLLLLLLRWPELAVVRRAIALQNKIEVVACLEALRCDALASIPAGHGGEGDGRGKAASGVAEMLLAGLGGEGEMSCGAATSASRARRGPPEVRAGSVELWSGRRTVLLSCSRRLGGEATVTATTSFLFALDAPREVVRSALHLTGAAICGDPKQRICFLRYAWPERPLRARPEPSFFFHGTMAAPACAHQFLRKLINLFTGSIAGGAPSGSLPGGGAGSRSARSSRSGGEDRGLDRVFHLFPKGFSTNLLALSVKSLFCRGLDVICNHRLDNESSF